MHTQRRVVRILRILALDAFPARARVGGPLYGRVYGERGEPKNVSRANILKIPRTPADEVRR